MKTKKIMKVYISYFYQIRFMNKDLLPVSTAKLDPKWFYDFKQGWTHVDNRGVVNGCRLDILNFPDIMYKQLQKNNISCDNCEARIAGAWCEFMHLYYDYLNQYVNFTKDVYGRLQAMLWLYKAKDIVLIVHEPPSKPCAERPVLVRWFADNGITVEEWNKEKYYEKIKFR